MGAAEVSAGGGHDTNMFLQVSADPGLREPLVKGWFGRAAPKLSIALALGGWRLETSYQLDYRRVESAGNLMHQELDLSISTPALGPLSPTLSLAAGRFDANVFAEDRFIYAAGEAGLRWAITSAWRAAISYRGELRRYPDPARLETNIVHLGELRLAHLPDRAGGTYMTVAPLRAAAIGDGTLRAIRLGPDVELVHGRFTLEAGGWGGSLEVAGRRREWQVGAGAGLLVRLSNFLDAAANYEWSAAPWAADEVKPGYARRYFVFSLIGHVSGRKAWRPAEPESLRPVVNGGHVRLRLRAKATAVEVIGSWNDWQTPGQPLAPGESGVWETSLELPPGSHRYRFLVDGQAVRPPDAPRYAADDFGGEDGVLEVTSSPGSR
jgi:hypothetical protein